MSNNISDPTATPPNLEERVDALIVKRKEWEEGEYQSSTNILYNVLAECLEVKYFIERGGAAARSAFDTLLERHTIKFRADTPVTKSIIRLVFGDCKRRADIYSSTIQAAFSRDISPEHFPAWVKIEGGVEQVAELKDKSRQPKMSQETLIEIAKLTVPTAQILATIPAIAELAPASNSYYDLSVALIRRTSDGASHVIYGTNKKTVISAVLATLGKALASQLEEVEIVERTKADAVKLRQRVTQAVVAHKAAPAGDTPHASAL